MFPSHKIKTFFSILLTASVILLSNPVYAKVCKGMSHSACSQSTSCSWIKGYKTKTGNTVAAYCRNKASKKNNEEKTSKTRTKKSEAKKSSLKDKDKNKKSGSKKTDSEKKDKRNNFLFSSLL